MTVLAKQDLVKGQYRTHHCGQLRNDDNKKRVRVAGWVHNIRDHGSIIFIDLRDHYGLTQVVVNPDQAIQAEVARLHKETVVQFDGIVELRSDGAKNPNLPTGDIEVIADAYEVLGVCEHLPLNVFPEDEAPEETRLKYRFLDLRRSKIHQNIILRSKVISSIRRRMTDLGFNEFQTPILTSDSPEGARSFVVPSRVHRGKFYALPQAPQQFKQLLMVSGFDRYFQVAPCFRDEDARADRSPGEFYQLDIEMSFVTQDDVFAVVEKLLTGLFAEFSKYKITEAPFVRIPFEESMLKYGSDKPDLRIPLEIRDISELFANSDFKAFAGKTVRALPVPNCGGQPRSFFDKMETSAKSLGAPGLAWVVLKEDGTLKGPIAKFLNEADTKKLIELCDLKVDGCIFFAADKKATVAAKLLGAMRAQIGRELDLIEKDVFKFCWITDFPMFEFDEETQKIVFSHNPFSMPQGGMEALLNQKPEDVKAYQYDIVCNGYELSSGAIRNHRPDIMFKAFEIAGYTQQEVEDKFGGMINAFKYGAPPHGGTAPGIDRIVMLLAEESNIREVTAFPMNQKAQDLLMNAPSSLNPKLLRELGIQIVEKKLQQDTPTG